MKTIEFWLERYFRKYIGKGILSKRCNNFFLFKDVMDTYNDFLHDSEHDWNEDIYFLNIDDVITSYLSELSEKNKITRTYVRICYRLIGFRNIQVKKYVRRSVSTKHRDRFDEKYGKHIEKVYYPKW